MLINYMISMDGYSVLRIVSGRKRFSLYKSPIDFGMFKDISDV